MASWLHVPPQGAMRQRGVVVCAPMGYEYTHSYRTLLHLADALAGQGAPTVRFDYYGTGSSPGNAFSGALLETWVQDVLAARALLEDMTGHSPSLLGLRLGATIACLAASQAPVQDLVVWAPVVSGRSYVREREAMAKIAGVTRLAGDECLEVGGFALPDETAAELTRVDLAKLDYRIAGGVLVLERDDLSAAAGLAGVLTSRGISVETLQVPGYMQMMDEPHRTVVPREAIQVVTSWLTDRTPRGQVSARVSKPADACPPRVIDGPACSEELIELAGAPALFGVLTTPATASPQPPLLVLANAGSVHQVGPNRVYVELSRALAEAGVATLRLDLRNLGDSIRTGTPQENHPYPDTALDDLARTVDWAENERGYNRIVIGGICSGAHAAFHAGLKLPNASLAGAVVVNPLTFYWHDQLSLDIPPAHQTIKDAKYYAQAIRDPSRWLKLVRGKADTGYLVGFLIRRAIATVTVMARRPLENLHLVRLRPLAQDLLAYSAKGRRVDFVFSASDPGHAILMADARGTVRHLQEAGAISLSLIEGPDHTFSRRQWRIELSRILADRLNQ